MEHCKFEGNLNLNYRHSCFGIYNLSRKCVFVNDAMNQGLGSFGFLRFLAPATGCFKIWLRADPAPAQLRVYTEVSAPGGSETLKKCVVGVECWVTT